MNSKEFRALLGKLGSKSTLSKEKTAPLSDEFATRALPKQPASSNLKNLTQRARNGRHIDIDIDSSSLMPCSADQETLLPEASLLSAKMIASKESASIFVHRAHKHTSQASLASDTSFKTTREAPVAVRRLQRKDKNANLRSQYQSVKTKAGKESVFDYSASATADSDSDSHHSHKVEPTAAYTISNDHIPAVTHSAHRADSRPNGGHDIHYRCHSTHGHSHGGCHGSHGGHGNHHDGGVYGGF